MQQIRFLNLLMKFVIYALLSCCYFSNTNLHWARFSYKIETSWSFGLGHLETLFLLVFRSPFLEGFLWKKNYI